MTYHSKRSKACDISSAVRREVQERDKICIFCGSPCALEIAHYISRGAGGLGIKENLTLACHTCHDLLDHSGLRAYREWQKSYLDDLYPDFKDEDRRYHKWKK